MNLLGSAHKFNLIVDLNASGSIISRFSI
jgi:predicted esterase YcpF (UPF0227 family)